MIENKYVFKPSYTYKEQFERDIKDQFMRAKIIPKQVFVERHVFAAMFGNSPGGRFVYGVADALPTSLVGLSSPPGFPFVVHEVEVLSEGA